MTEKRCIIFDAKRVSGLSPGEALAAFLQNQGVMVVARTTYEEQTLSLRKSPRVSGWTKTKDYRGKHRSHTKGAGQQSLWRGDRH
ncbi:hypothetical protein ACFL2C_03950 [Patescibacteria group bacterium]